MLKILFIYKEEDPIDPLQIELLSALAKREGHQTFLNILQHKDLVSDLERIQPDIVATSGKTGEHNTFLKVNRFVKETYGDRIFTVMGGPHTTFNHSGMRLHGETDHEFQAFREKLAAAPDHSKYPMVQRHVVPERSGLDALCIGEGEDAWVELLQALDQKRSIEYDIESVELAVQTGVQQSLFPRLEPYPGTVATEYTISIGAFDGNFEKLHSSCLTTSLFTCFTPQQRKIQDNLSFLGQVCAVWPWLWPFAKKHLIYWPLTRFYWALFILTKGYAVHKHIYPMKFDLKSFLKSAYRIGMFEIKQFFRSKADSEFYRKPAASLSSAASPAGVLGGRWEK